MILLLTIIVALAENGTRPDGAGMAVPVSLPSADVLLYDAIAWGDARPDRDAFRVAVKGYYALQDSLDIFGKPFMTLIDFSKPSSVKRLWVIDLAQKKVLLHTWVAHGRNSGELHATRFSNSHHSFQSSLGFYATGSTYSGKHGLSLILRGLETGINDQAERRSIVIHGAHYVNEDYIRNTGRLGRSQGCPAVSMEIYQQLIRTIQGGTCVFIYHPDATYFRQSTMIRSPGQPRLHASE